MSDEPVFNDRGEVVAVSAFVRVVSSSGGPQAAFLDNSSHAIAVNALHGLPPRPW